MVYCTSNILKRFLGFVSRDRIISDYIPYENIKWRLYDGRQCGNGAADITNNNFLLTSESTEGDFDVRGDGNAYRNLTLKT
jgi:hypothetical protein